jgi:hypothetical protein
MMMIVKHGQEKVEDPGMGLFDFIEEQDGEGCILHSPREDALFFVPHIAGRRAN